MNKTKWITIGTAVFWLAVLVAWHLYDPSSGFTAHEPGADERPAGSARKADEVVIGEYFMKYDEPAPEAVEDGEWVGFRGSNRDNICTEKVKLASGDFKVMWNVETGEGHAAPVIWNGRVYVLDYNEQLSSDALRCFNLQTGKELWRRWYRVTMKRNHGFSRTIPAIHDGKIVTVGPEGHVMCCDAVSGDLIWTMDMKKEFESEIPFWYTGQCPYISENGTLILAPSGTETLMLGVDCANGEIKWKTPNTPQFKMSHSSVMPMTLGGKKTYVYIGVGGVCGVSAEGSDEGQLLWSTSKWQPSVVAPSPLQISGNQAFLVAGYGAGGAVLQVDKSGSGWKAEIKEQYKADKGLSCEQQTPVLYNGMMITVIPKDGGSLRERLVCYSPGNLHSAIWNSAADERFGLGPFMVIDGKLFVFKEDGELYVYQIESKSMKLLKKQRVMEEGIDAWGPMAYADGCLIVRDSKNVCCLKITE